MFVPLVQLKKDLGIKVNLKTGYILLWRNKEQTKRVCKDGGRKMRVEIQYRKPRRRERDGEGWRGLIVGWRNLSTFQF